MGLHPFYKSKESFTEKPKIFFKPLTNNNEKIKKKMIMQKIKKTYNLR
jgi:hypothetical protein